VNKWLVSWCPEPGIDTGLLPGLCVEHRDQTVAKQKEALESTKSATIPGPSAGRFEPISPGAFTSAVDHARDMRLIEQMRTEGASSCVCCGRRSKDVMMRTMEVERKGARYSVLASPTMLCEDCERQIMRAHSL
jgi:hypothetical protein